MSISVSSHLAPVSLFAFRRPVHTRRALEALDRNIEFRHSPLYVFCDAARREQDVDQVKETRQIIQQWPHSNKIVIEATQNRGLARSIEDGVNKLCGDHGRAIVVEDDLVVAPVFLAYMNNALDRYADTATVKQVSGYMYPIEPPPEVDAFFLNLTTSWGWATWQRAWSGFRPDRPAAARVLGSLSERYRFDQGGAYPYARLLADQLAGKKDSWAIWWYLNVYLSGGLTLFPSHSLVNNEGDDPTATHPGGIAHSSMRLPTAIGNNHSPVQDHEVMEARIRRHLIGSRGLLRFAKDNWMRLFPRQIVGDAPKP